MYQLLIRKFELHNFLGVYRMAEYEKARGIHMGLIWDDPYRSARLIFMWGPCGAEPFGPIWVNSYGPTWGIPHGPICGNSYGPARLQFMCSPYRIYTLWDCPLGSDTEPIWDSPYGHAQLKHTWGPQTHVTWEVLLQKNLIIKIESFH